MLTDINVSYGAWPFQRFPFKSLRALADHLEAGEIGRALVSHLGGVFYPDPDPFNREIIEAAEALEVIDPVPVINPAYPGWQSCLDAYCSSINVKAVKIHPSFHNYRCCDELVEPMAAYLIAHKIPLLVQIRMEDERMQYFALNIQGVPVEDIISLEQRFPDLKIICLNAYLPEARRIGKETNNVCVDTAFAEWQYTMDLLLEDLRPDRIFFGSHTPFLYTQAGTMKLLKAPIAETVKHQIGTANADQIFPPPP